MLYFRPVQRIAELVSRWYVALACVVVVAGAVLLPGLDGFGLWEPQERQLADKASPRDDLAQKPAPLPPKPNEAQAQQQAELNACPKSAPKDAVARSLTPRAAAFGRDYFDDSDGGRRLPFALLGLLTVLATAGVAMRGAGPRAGVITALVLLSMPLLVLQSRQLTSEIGTAAGGALTVYGLVALGSAGGVLGIVESVVALAALVGGIALGFAGGGVLMGLIVPIGAYAAAGALGAPAVMTIARASRAAAVRVAGAIRPRAAIGRGTGVDVGETPLAEQIKALVATLAAIALIALLVYQVFELREPQPGLSPPQRALLGKAIVPGGCWSSALGAVWRPDDDLRFIYDSTWEQIAYGTFPWGILAPVAMMGLLAGSDRKRQKLGALALAWAGGAWIASEVFQRKVGFTLFAGFPAVALAVGAWLDDMLAAKERAPSARLVAVFVVLGVLVLGKDIQSFTERVTSMLVGGDAITYPTMSKLLWIPTRVWVLVLGMIVALGCAFALVFSVRGVKIHGPSWLRWIARAPLVAVLGGTVAMAVFWAEIWQPALAQHLSSKALFDTYEDLKKPGDTLVLMGDIGDAQHDYAPEAKPQLVTTREQVVAALGRPERVFAFAPQTELCQLHREVGGKPYFVVDDRNLKMLLLSNRVDGTTDKNPLATAIVHQEPKDIPFRPKAKIVFDNRVQLLGWDIPKSVHRGSRFDVKMYFKVLQPVGGSWTVLMHFDGTAGRAGNGDHPPIANRCPTSTWQPGDFVVDSFSVPGLGAAFPSGQYEVWTGFFTGANPNWKNMPVSEAPGDMRDNTDRVKITSILLD